MSPAPPTLTTPTTPTTPTETVAAFLDAFAAMDVDTAVGHLADDCDYTNMPLGTVHGHEGVNSVFEVHEGSITVWRDDFDLPTTAAIHDPAPS